MMLEHVKSWCKQIGGELVETSDKRFAFHPGNAPQVSIMFDSLEEVKGWIRGVWCVTRRDVKGTAAGKIDWVREG